MKTFATHYLEALEGYINNLVQGMKNAEDDIMDQLTYVKHTPVGLSRRR